MNLRRNQLDCSRGSARGQEAGDRRPLLEAERVVVKVLQQLGRQLQRHSLGGQRGGELGGCLQAPVDDEAGAVGEAGRGRVQRPPDQQPRARAAPGTPAAGRGRAGPLLGREGGVVAHQRRHALELRHQLPDPVVRVQRELAAGEEDADAGGAVILGGAGEREAVEEARVLAVPHQEGSLLRGRQQRAALLPAEAAVVPAALRQLRAAPRQHRLRGVRVRGRRAAGHGRRQLGAGQLLLQLGGLQLVLQHADVQRLQLGRDPLLLGPGLLHLLQQGGGVEAGGGGGVTAGGWGGARPAVRHREGQGAAGTLQHGDGHQQRYTRPRPEHMFREMMITVLSLSGSLSNSVSWKFCSAQSRLGSEDECCSALGGWLQLGLGSPREVSGDPENKTFLTRL